MAPRIGQNSRTVVAEGGEAPASWNGVHTAVPQHAEVVKPVADELLEAVRSRQKSLAGFFKSNHQTAVARSQAILGNGADAEDVVSETFIELVQGRTTEGHFFRALRLNALNRRQKNAGETRRHLPMDRVVTPMLLSIAECAWGPGGVDTVSLEPISGSPEDQDPLEILLAREEQTAEAKLVEAARKDPRWRYVKRKKWARPLLRECAETATSPE